MIYGYVRVSTKRQSIERQIRNIQKEYPEALIIQETYTGTTMDRPKWNKLLCRLTDGDIVIFDSVSRMARTSESGFETYETLYNKGVDLVFLKEPQINTTTYKKAKEKSIPLTNTTVDFILEGINNYLLALAKEQIILAFNVAQKETDDLRQKTKEGLLTAKLSGRTLGHRQNTPLIHKQSLKDKDIILRHSKAFGGSLSDVDVMKMCKCSRKTYYKYKKELLVGLRPL